VGEGSASCLGRSLPQGKTWYPLYRRLGGLQCQSGEMQKISPPPGFNPRTIQPVAQSLYRLSYPAHIYMDNDTAINHRIMCYAAIASKQGW